MAKRRNNASIKETSAAKAFLKQMGADTNDAGLITAVVAWMRAESGTHPIGNNPFNLRPGADDAQFRSGVRQTKNRNGYFSIYKTLEDGLRATANRLIKAGGDWRGYAQIVLAARAGDVAGFLMAIALSAWDGGHDPNKGHYGLKGVKVGVSYTGGHNNLFDIYKSITGLLLAPAKAKPTAPRKPLPPPPQAVIQPPAPAYFTSGFEVAGFYRARHPRTNVLS